jgi:hypothetical protein
MGAVVDRIGIALHEETVIDNRYGRFNNHSGCHQLCFKQRRG